MGQAEVKRRKHVRIRLQHLGEILYSDTKIMNETQSLLNYFESNGGVYEIHGITVQAVLHHRRTYPLVDRIR
jgi:hypothetical protein